MTSDAHRSLIPFAPDAKKCAVCGTLIEGESQELRGIYGRGWRHVDVMVCYAACNFQADDDE